MVKQTTLHAHTPILIAQPNPPTSTHRSQSLLRGQPITPSLPSASQILLSWIPRITSLIPLIPLRYHPILRSPHTHHGPHVPGRRRHHRPRTIHLPHAPLHLFLHPALDHLLGECTAAAVATRAGALFLVGCRGCRCRAHRLFCPWGRMRIWGRGGRA